MIHIEDLLNRIVIFLLILSTGTIISQAFGKYIIVLSFLFIIFLFLIQKKNKLNYISFYSIILSLFIILLVILISIKNKQTDQSNYANILISIFILSLYNMYIIMNKIKILDHLYIVLKIVLFFSVLNLILTNGFSSFFIHSLDRMDVSSLLYMFNYHSTQELFNFTVYRNQGIFWEPGILQIFMNILLFLSLFIYKNKYITYMTSFIILTTFSTTGLIIMGIVLIYYFSLRKKTLLNIIIYILILMLAIIFLYLNIDDKINTKYASVFLRTYDLLIAIEILIDNLFVGIGYYPELYESIQLNYTSSISEFSVNEGRGNTNSIIMMGTYFGIFALLLYLISIYNQNIVVKNKKMFFIVIFLSLASEPLGLMNFFLFLFINGFYTFINNKLRIYS